MPIQIASDQQFILNARLRGLQPAIDLNEPTTLSQVQALVARNAFKDDARVKAPGNVPLAAPGADIDGVALVLGDRVLIATQTAATENGVYIWNGAAVPMTRSFDTATFADLESAIVLITEGTAGGTRWRQTGVNGTIGTNPVSFISDAATVPQASETISGVAEIATQSIVDAGVNDSEIVTPIKLKNSIHAHRVVTQVIGDGVASSFSVPHGFATTSVDIVVRENSGVRREIVVENDTPDANTARVLFAGVPAANSYVVYVTRK